MKLKNLVHYKDNDSDEIIFNLLIKSMDKDILDYVINVTSDLLNGVFIANEYKVNTKNNLANFSDYELGEIATYITITPYVQNAMININNWQEKATIFLECYIGYIIGTISKEDFLVGLIEMKNLLNMSDNFYNGLVIYFKENKEVIINRILKKLQF